MTESRAPSAPLTLSWKNVTISTGDRILLNNISGSVCGEFMAIMGSTGSGKTTFMNALAKRIKGVKVEGEILINHEPVTSSLLKSVSGYVMQDDMLFANLTVEETLSYAALLRLPNEFTKTERQNRVDEVIRLLGLEKCRHTPIGGALRRGISGGEKKRVCVAVELLNRPQILFLDEPTSGLDSTNAFTLCSALKQLCLAYKCTIVATIHQPQAKIFSLFDRVLLLNQGEMIYFGPVEQVGPIYERAGFPLPANVNPADHMMDVITPTSASDSSQIADAQQKLKDVQIHEFDEIALEDTPPPTKERLPWLSQFHTLLRRAAKEQIRNPRLVMTQLIQTIVMALLIGFVFFQLGNSLESIPKRKSVLFFCVINQGIFAALMLVNSFPEERAITLRERAAGAYNVSSYFLAKSCIEVSVTLLYPFVFSLVVYWIIGLQSSFVNFIVFASFLCLCCLASTSLALLISSLCKTTTLSLAVLPMALEVGRLFGGFFLPPIDLPAYFIWLDAFSYVKYSYVGISINEFTGLTFECQPEELEGGLCPVVEGEEVLESLGMDKYSLGICYGALIGLIALFRVGAFLGLRFLK